MCESAPTGRERIYAHPGTKYLRRETACSQTTAWNLLDVGRIDHVLGGFIAYPGMCPALSNEQVLSNSGDQKPNAVREMSDGVHTGNTCTQPVRRFRVQYMRGT